VRSQRIDGALIAGLWVVMHNEKKPKKKIEKSEKGKRLDEGGKIKSPFSFYAIFT
jgi:hypothetical protein